MIAPLTWVHHETLGYYQLWENDMRMGYEAVRTERRMKLEELLGLAKCPDTDCDGEGTGVKDGEPYECEWCSQRNAVLEIGR